MLKLRFAGNFVALLAARTIESNTFYVFVELIFE